MFVFGASSSGSGGSGNVARDAFGRPCGNQRAGRKKGSSGQTPLGGPVTGSLFGSSAGNAFGQLGLSGQQSSQSSNSFFAPSASGSPGSNIFGGSSPGNLFGQLGLSGQQSSQSSNSLFAPSASGSLGANSSGGSNGQHVFGQFASSTGSLFGSSANDAGRFGWPGQQSSQNSNSFFAPSPSGSLGSNIFGGNSAQQVFGQFTSSIGNIFGSSTNNTFAQPVGNTGSLFGSTGSNSFTLPTNSASPQPVGNTGSVFGSIGSSSFALSTTNANPQPVGNTGSLFGSFGSSSFAMPTSSASVCLFGQQKSESANSLTTPSQSASLGSNIFGGSSANAAFGQLANSEGFFGSAGNVFGQSGSSATQSNLFTPSSSGGLFGTSNASFSIGCRGNLVASSSNTGSTSNKLLQPQQDPLWQQSPSMATNRMPSSQTLDFSLGSNLPSSIASHQFPLPNSTVVSSADSHANMFSTAPTAPIDGLMCSSTWLMQLPPRPHLPRSATRVNPWKRCPESALSTSAKCRTPGSFHGTRRSLRFMSPQIDNSSLFRFAGKRSRDEEDEREAENFEIEAVHVSDLSDEDVIAPVVQSRVCKKPRKEQLQDESVNQTASCTRVLDVATPMRRKVREITTSPVKVNFIRHDVGQVDQTSTKSESRSNKLVPSLTRAGYFSTPSIDQMSMMSEQELASIDNFQVCCEGRGSIKWFGLTDVRGLDLDEIVSILEGKVSVYWGSRPLVGVELNKKAVISLNVKRQAASDEEASRLIQRIQYLTEKAGHKFISYDLDTWVFSVPNFEISES